MNKMTAELKGKGFQLIAVNLGDDEKTVAKLWKDSKFSMRAGLHGDKVSDLYKVTAIPTNYVVGHDGKIIGAFLGFDEAGIRKALAKAGVK